MRKLDAISTEALLATIQKASPLDKPAFTTVRRKMALKFEKDEQRQKNKVKAEKATADKFYINPEQTIEMHLFGVTFEESNKERSVIDQAFREYDDQRGYWKTIDDDGMRKIIQRNAKKSYKLIGKNAEKRYQGKPSFVDSALKYAATELYEPNASSRTHLRSFKNGTVNLKTGQLEQHNKSNYLTAHIPYDYYPEKTDCPEPFLRYVESSMGLEALASVRAGLSMILDPTAPDKFIHLVGPSGSGKGVMAYLISQMFGPESVKTDNSFKKLGDPDQRHQYLQGCSLFVIDDITDYVGGEIGSFYTLVERTATSGRSLFSSKAYNTVFNTRYVVCSTGPIPAKSSTSKGWNRRVFPLPTRAVIGAENPNLRLELKECIADIISWALAMDKAERNAILANPAEYSDGAARYLMEADLSSNSVRAFIDSCLRPVEPGNEYFAAPTEVGILYDHYRAYCLAMGVKSMSQNTFAHQLAESISAHLIPTHLATKNDPEYTPSKRVRIPSKWVYLALEDSAFSIKQNPDVFDGRSEIVLCKPGMKEGNLELFRTWAANYQSYYPYSETAAMEANKANISTNELLFSGVHSESTDDKGVEEERTGRTQGTPHNADSEDYFADPHVFNAAEGKTENIEPKKHDEMKLFIDGEKDGVHSVHGVHEGQSPDSIKDVERTPPSDRVVFGNVHGVRSENDDETHESGEKSIDNLPPLPEGFVDF